jgi:hypothetical protein
MINYPHHAWLTSRGTVKFIHRKITVGFYDFYAGISANTQPDLVSIVQRHGKTIIIRYKRIDISID